MVTLFWLAFATAIGGTLMALRGIYITLSRVIILTALGSAMGALVIDGGIAAYFGVPLLSIAAVIVALTEVDASG